MKLTDCEGHFKRIWNMRVGELLFSNTDEHSVLVNKIFWNVSDSKITGLGLNLQSYIQVNGRRIFFCSWPSENFCPVQSLVKYLDIRKSVSPYLFIHPNTTSMWLLEKLCALLSILHLNVSWQLFSILFCSIYCRGHKEALSVIFTRITSARLFAQSVANSS